MVKWGEHVINIQLICHQGQNFGQFQAFIADSITTAVKVGNGSKLSFTELAFKRYALGKDACFAAILSLYTQLSLSANASYIH